MRVVRADGYEAEASMPYAALQRIGTPFRDHLPQIPERQVAALRIAARLDTGQPPDRFLVGRLSGVEARGDPQRGDLPFGDLRQAVSYTHLTLPTICSV